MYMGIKRAKPFMDGPRYGGPTPVRIDVEEVVALQARRRLINRISFEDIAWYFGGNRIEVSKQVAEEWCLMGMNNVDFVETMLPEENDKVAVAVSEGATVAAKVDGGEGE